MNLVNELHQQPTTESQVIAHFPDREMSVEVVTIASTGTAFTLKAGTILALNSSTDKYVEPTIGGANDTGTGAALPAVDIDVPAAGDVQAVVWRRHAIAKAGAIIYPDAATDAQKAALRADLEVRALLIR